jgi:hypothetical protein
MRHVSEQNAAMKLGALNQRKIQSVSRLISFNVKYLLCVARKTGRLLYSSPNLCVFRQ